MPPSTARYGFETRLAAWADGFARQLAGARCGFLVAFRADGSLRRVYVLPPGQALDGERKQSLTQAYRRWFLFSPYEDDPDRAWMEWLDLPVTVAERWLEDAVTAADLVDAQDRADLEAWPGSWRVIVG